jgi:4-hydroxy-2-oxoheptanedioate aldolase
METADEARALVAAVRYARPSDHASILVVALVESVRALENLDAIAAVDGLDALFVGSGDLSNSLGLAGQRFHPEVVRRVHEAGRRIVALGKAAGTRVTTENAAGFKAAGFRLLYENAGAFLTQGFAQFKAAANGPQLQGATGSSTGTRTALPSFSS